MNLEKLIGQFNRGLKQTMSNARVKKRTKFVKTVAKEEIQASEEPMAVSDSPEKRAKKEDADDLYTKRREADFTFLRDLRMEMMAIVGQCDSLCREFAGTKPFPDSESVYGAMFGGLEDTHDLLIEYRENGLLDCNSDGAWDQFMLQYCPTFGCPADVWPAVNWTVELMRIPLQALPASPKCKALFAELRAAYESGAETRDSLVEEILNELNNIVKSFSEE